MTRTELVEKFLKLAGQSWCMEEGDTEELARYILQYMTNNQIEEMIEDYMEID